MTIQAVGWSEDMRWGAASTWGTTDLTSRDTQMWPSLSPLFPEWRRPPLALPAPSGRTGTQDCSQARRARPGFAHPYSDKPGESPEWGFPLSGSTHSLDTWTDGPWSGTRGILQTM